MHVPIRSVVIVAFVACAAPTAAPQPLDGLWVPQATTAGFTPRTMKLSQRGVTITGTGSAMGVDRPIPIARSGTFTGATAASGRLVDLTFRFAENGQLAGEFTGALNGADQLDGSVTVNIASPPPPESVSFVRQ